MKAWTGIVRTISGTGVVTVGAGTEGRIVDSNGVEFAPRLLFFHSANAVKNTLSYQSGTNNALVDSRGIDDGTNRAASAFADIGRFGVKCCGNGDSGTYSYLDFQSDLFFGGNFQGYGYVSRLATGEFDLTLDLNLRGPEDILVVALGGTDLEFNYTSGFLDGAVALPDCDTPLALLTFPAAYAVGSGSGTTTAVGGKDCPTGWETYRGTRGVVNYRLDNQSAVHVRGYATDRCLGTVTSGGTYDALPATTVSAWGANSITLANSSARAQNGVVLGGTGLDANNGHITQPAADSTQVIDLGIKARWVRFMSAGTTSAAKVSTAGCEFVVGDTDGTRQGSVWTGENAANTSATTGARYVVDDSLIRFATPNAGGTTFHSVMRLVSLDASKRYATVEWTGVDGTQREVLWFAIGDEDTGTPTTKLLVADDSGVGADDTEPFQAYILSKAYAPGGRIDTLGLTREAHLVAKSTDSTVQLQVIRNMGLEVDASTITASGAGTHTIQKFEDAGLADMQLVQFRLGDASAVEDLWSLDRLHVIRKKEGEA